MTYEQSFHVDAPVTKVFDFFRDPHNWAALGPEGVQFKDVRLTEEGLGTHYSWAAKIAGVTIEGFNVFTEFVPDRHITDRSSSSLEGTWTYSFEPEGSGTRLTVENRVRSFWRLPPLERLLDRVAAKTHEPRFARLKTMLEE
jgi:carbon monoxide dehydrogenase subunit G